MHRYYQTCYSNIGKVAQVRCTDGRHYTGRITHVTPQQLHLSPVGRGIKEEQNKQLVKQAVGSKDEGKGEQVFFFAPFAVPLAAIAGLTIVGTAPFWGRGFYGPRRFGPHGRFGPYRRGFFW